jgi:superfamily I DNA/RNA helicase
MTLVRREDWRPQGIDDLEPGAWEALRQVDQSILVTAGAGAGKTEFLAQKAAFLLQTGTCPAPRRVLAISFKRDAARNLAERVQLRCDPDQARRFDSVTFDAFAKSLLDRFRDAIPDQWKPPADYDIVMSKTADFTGFLNARGIGGVNAKQLEKAIAETPLPFPPEGQRDARVSAAATFWADSMDGQRWRISFAMINRLVHLMLGENHDVRTALRATYPYVFLDEFQDTTFSQFEVLETAFLGGPARMTAVGDDKQRIMIWAGAMPDAFERFQNDFQAARSTLVINWRSHEDLVSIQHVIAQRLTPEIERPVALGARQVDGDVAAIWDFPNPDVESRVLADWIAREVEAGVMQPHDVAILVRMYADAVEADLREAFVKRGLRLRNVARDIQGIAVQDLLGEDMTGLLLPLLRLGATATSPVHWSETQRNLRFMHALAPDDSQLQEKLQRRLEVFVRGLRQDMGGTVPDALTARTFAERTRDFWGEELIRQVFPAYRAARDFHRVWNGFTALLSESAAVGANWSAVLDEFEGKGQVPLMTIHKSKGLEFHTMIFYGLDNQTWWSLQPNRREDLTVFFVALTRAKQRAFFLLCRARGQPIQWIEDLIVPAGLRHIYWQ